LILLKVVVQGMAFAMFSNPNASPWDARVGVEEKVKNDI
jgi:hypothetical protein